MKKILSIFLTLILALPIVLWGQTPDQLRVRTDANGYLVIAGGIQTNPVTTSVFSVTRLRTDASGNLLVVFSGGPVSGAITLADSTCAAPSLARTSGVTTGIAFTATPSILNCIAGVAVTTLTASSFTSTVPIDTTGLGAVITRNGTRFLHNYFEAGSDGQNTFVGLNAGNLTMGPAGGASHLGSNNTAIGWGALFSNTTGYNNTASGVYVLFSNTTGSYNTASGQSALLSNTTGFQNMASGQGALYSNTTGYSNTANGMDALYSNETGYNNTASGQSALFDNTTGYNNTASGQFALPANETGFQNTAIGLRAGYTATPANANVSGDNLVFIGYNSGPGSVTQLSNAIAIGSGALVSTNNTAVLGNANITSTILRGNVTTASPTGGIGYATGAGGTVTQITSKATGVTLNTVTGLITLNAAALAADTTVTFTLTDSAIAATDSFILTHQSGGTAGSYTLNAQAAAGSATINVRNITPGSLSEAIVIRFTVIKSVSS